MSLIDDFGAVYPFKRYGAPVNVKGQLQKPAEVTPGTLTMVASIQPLGTFDALNLAEGLRNRDAQKVYTTTQLRVADEDAQLFGDRFMYKGHLYEVSMGVDWTDQPLSLTHYKYIATKVPKA